MRYIPCCGLQECCNGDMAQSRHRLCEGGSVPTIDPFYRIKFVTFIIRLEADAYFACGAVNSKPDLYL